MKVELTPEDRKRFSGAARTAGPTEILQVWEFVDSHKDRIAKESLEFMYSHMGRRAEKLLRMAVKYQSWEDAENGDRKD